MAPRMATSFYRAVHRQGADVPAGEKRWGSTTKLSVLTARRPVSGGSTAGVVHLAQQIVAQVLGEQAAHQLGAGLAPGPVIQQDATVNGHVVYSSLPPVGRGYSIAPTCQGTNS